MSDYVQKYPVAVIGAGPAGLAAAYALSDQGLEFVVFEAGKRLTDRQRNVAYDLPTGVGGVGLFSDGKFSYYPSGTHAYYLADGDRLKAAYGWMAAQLRDVLIEVEPFPDEITHDGQMARSLREKKYPSHPSSLEQRVELIDRLSDIPRGTIFTGVTVSHIIRVPEGYQITVEDTGGSRTAHIVSAIVLATGRLGSLCLADGLLSDTIPMTELRYEFGIRVEFPHTIGFLNRCTAHDVKFMWEDGPIQFRTFCTCRRGEVWNIPYGSLSAISGRADGPPTEYSNFSVLARFTGESLKEGSQIWDMLRNYSLPSGKAVWEPLASFMQDASLPVDGNIDASSRPWFPREGFVRGEIHAWLGNPLHSILKAALRELIRWSPDLADSRTVCLFPTVEGIGLYPDIDQNLKVKGHNIWCAGDVGGKFRGLVPALLSGYYTGLGIKQALVEESMLSEGKLVYEYS